MSRRTVGTGPVDTDRRGPPSVSLTADVEWIHECYDLGGRHEHVSVYLIRTDLGNIVVDSGSFYHRDSIRERISEATGGEGIRALILSHSDFPHSANIGAFRRQWGDFEIVASVHCGCNRFPTLLR